MYLRNPYWNQRRVRSRSGTCETYSRTGTEIIGREEDKEDSMTGAMRAASPRRETVNKAFAQEFFLDPKC